MKVIQSEFVCENICMQIVRTQICVYMVHELYCLLVISTYDLEEKKVV